jgi:hypothetical protein
MRDVAGNRDTAVATANAAFAEVQFKLTVFHSYLTFFCTC